MFVICLPGIFTTVLHLQLVHFYTLSYFDMLDSDQTFTQTCICGCIFTGLTAFTQHEKGCAKGKKHLSGALSKAKEVYWNKKVHIQGAMDLGQDALEPNLAILEHWAEEHGSVDPASTERESNMVCKIIFWSRLLYWCSYTLEQGPYWTTT